MSNTNERNKAAAKIRALVAKQINRGCTEAEALAAMVKVGELLELYNLTMDEVSLREEKCSTLVIRTGRKAADSMQWLIIELGLFTNTKSWLSHYNKETGQKEVSYFFFGQQTDLDVVQYFYDLISTTMKTETDRFKQTRSYIDAEMYEGGRRRASTSFQRGFISRIDSRLSEMRHETMERQWAMEEENPGTAIIVLKQDIVAREFEKEPVSKQLRTTTQSQSQNNYNAYSKGSAAGGRVNLSRGITGSSNIGGYLS